MTCDRDLTLKRLMTITATLIAIYAIFTAFFFYKEDRKDLAYTVLGETISIYITVGVIDALIQQKEKRRWHFRELLLLARAFDCLDEFLHLMLPQELNTLSSKAYSHGRIHVVQLVGYNNKKALKTQLPLLLKKNIKSGAVSFTTCNQTVSAFRDNLDHILDHYSALPDHNLIIDELLDLRYTYLLSLPKNNLKDEKEIAGAVDEWVVVILKVIEVRKVLLKQMKQNFVEE